MDGLTDDGDLFDELPAGVIVASADGTTQAANAAFARWAGQNAEFRAILRHAAPDGREEAEEHELLLFGPDGTTPIPPGKRFLPRLSEGEAFSEELIWIGPETDRRAISVTGRPAHDDSIDGSVVAFDDITRLATALAARDSFIAGISHELRTPLTSIMGFLQLALDDDLPPHLRSWLEASLRNSERLLQLVTDLLSVAGSTQKKRPEKQVTNLARILAERMQAIEPRAQERNISLVGEFPESIPASIDPAGIARVLDSLLSNAVKFSYRGDQVTVRAWHHAQDAVIEVMDTGIGMTAQEQAEAFGTFFRSAGVSKAAIPGAGLGLSIAKTIVEAHDGAIALTSVPVRGTTVTVTLPAPVNPCPSEN